MRISIIGAGAMGGAMAKGFLKSGSFSHSDIMVSAPSQQTLDQFAPLGIATTANNSTAAKHGDVVCVVVKPWLVEGVLKEIKPSMDYDRQTLVVVAAGITGKQVTEWMDNGKGQAPETVLAIPNTAIEVKSSMTFIAPVNASPATVKTVEDLFNETGKAMTVEEKQLGAGMVLASCGLAYAMRYVRAASEGGVELGFRANMAKEIVLQTMKGAVDLLQANGNHPEAEIDKVTTAGGVTIKGLNEMEHAGFSSAVIRGLKAGLK